MAKRITFVCLDLANGGAERVISILINALISRGYQVQLVLLRKNLIAYPIPETVKVVFWGDCNFFTSVLKLRRTINGDCAIAFLPMTILQTVLALAGKKTKVIVSARTDPRKEPNTKIRRFLRNVTFFMADACVFQTEEAKAYFPKSVQKKGTIILNPLRNDIPERYTGQREKNIVAAGRLSEQKNFPLLLKAFAKLAKEYPDHTLTIYGRGPLEEELRTLAQQLGVGNRVLFPGFVQDVDERMQTAAMYISSSDYEGISNSMLEAMAMGLPVVCTDCPVGGARMMITHGENGMLVPVGDENALYLAMKKVLAEPAFADKLSQNACMIRQRLATEKIVDQWVELL